jgi:hypothetical protein
MMLGTLAAIKNIKITTKIKILIFYAVNCQILVEVIVQTPHRRWKMIQSRANLWKKMFFSYNLNQFSVNGALEYVNKTISFD